MHTMMLMILRVLHCLVVLQIFVQKIQLFSCNYSALAVVEGTNLCGG